MELNGDGKKLADAGYYKHKETGAIVKLDALAGAGTPTIDAFIQVGFVKVDEPIEETKVVSEPKEDEYTEKETKSGAIQYRKNGKLISKDEYDKK